MSNIYNIYNNNIRLVYTIANSIATQYGVWGYLQDMEQEGFMGLWRACLKYDPAKGRFSVFARLWIKGRIMHWLRKQFKWNDRHTFVDLPILDYLCTLNGKELVEVHDTLDAIEREWDKFSPRQREIYQLFKTGYNHKETAEILGLHLCTVYRDFQRLNKKLKGVI